MAFGQSWDENVPDGSVITVSQLDNHQRFTKEAIRERLEGDPADANTGIIVSGSFTAAPKLKQLRGHIGSISNVSYGFDGFGDDGIFHPADAQVGVVTSGVERVRFTDASMQVLSGNVVVDGITIDRSNNRIVWATNGANTAGSIIKSSGSGLQLRGVTGSTYDLALANNAGTTVLGLVAGSTDLAVVSGVVAFGANAASAQIGVGNLQFMRGRNAANSSDIDMIHVNGSDDVVLGEGSTGVVIGPSSALVGFYGATPATKPTVTGSRGGNAALADLLTELATLGILTDSSS